MKATFVELTGFTDDVAQFLSDEAFAALQQALMADPAAGDVMPGCGGLRKVRTADRSRGKGTRGGGRVIYLHIPDAGRFYLLDIYGKDEKVDLSASEKKEYRAVADAIKATVIKRRTKEKR